MRKRRMFDFKVVPRQTRTLILACMLFWSVVSYLLISRFVLEAGEVVGQSMEPTLEAGERALIDRIVYRFRAPRRGEVVALRLPGDTDCFSVKRVIAVPGERIAIGDGRVFVNGIALREMYLPDQESTVAGPLEGKTFEVAQGCYFVLGDNRGVSADSRTFGAIPEEWIVGRVVW